MTSQPYWIESITGKVFTKVPELLPFETQLYAIAKVSGFTPNGNDVFDFFDDFDGTSLDTSKWTSFGSANITVSNGSILIDNTASIHSGIIGSTAFGYGYTINFKSKTNKAPGVSWGGMASTQDSNIDSVRVIQGGSGNAYHGINNTVASYLYYISLDTNYHVISISRPDATKVIYDYDDGADLYTNTNTTYIPTVDLYPHVSNWTNTGDTEIDWCLVRKYASIEPTVTVEDMGTWYKVILTNNVGETLTDYQVAIPSTDLDITSTTDSLRITQIDHGVSFEPHKDLFEDCIMYLDFMGDDKDVMGNHNGTVTGATLVEDRFGIQNAAYDFDGSNDYITQTLPSLTDSSKYTIVAVFKSDVTSTSQVVTAGDSGDESGRYMGYMDIMSNDVLRFTGTRHDGGALVSITPTNWNVAIGICDELSRSLYVNTIDNTNTTIESNNANIDLGRYIGRRDDGHYFNGQIALFMVFDNIMQESKVNILLRLLQHGYPYPIMTNTSGGQLE
jgi:hypothetical protein